MARYNQCLVATPIPFLTWLLDLTGSMTEMTSTRAAKEQQLRIGYLCDWYRRHAHDVSVVLVFGHGGWCSFASVKPPQFLLLMVG